MNPQFPVRSAQFRRCFEIRTGDWAGHVMYVIMEAGSLVTSSVAEGKFVAVMCAIWLCYSLASLTTANIVIFFELIEGQLNAWLYEEYLFLYLRVHILIPGPSSSSVAEASSTTSHLHLNLHPTTYHPTCLPSAP